MFGLSSDRAAAWRHGSLAAVVYAALSVAYTWPLAARLGTELPSDAGDPALNTAILWWNARVLPFSAAWWNAPHYYPSPGVAAFTENLASLSLVSTPVYWLTGNAVAAHNVAYLLTWPLSALAVFLLVRFLTGRIDAAFVAGAAFAFTPYRTTEIAHLQSLSAYGLPLCLLGLHAYLRTRRTRWLWLFGAAWLFQSFANGYYLLFGGVLITLWLAYFCARPSHWRVLVGIGLAWMAASLPVAAVMLRYARIHAQFGFSRTPAEILAFSATPGSWLQVSGDVVLWRRWLPSGTDNLFPGVVALACVVVGTSTLLWMRATGTGRPSSAPARATGVALLFVAIAATVATIVTLAAGPWSLQVSGALVRMRDLTRALPLAVASAVGATCVAPGVRRALWHRSPLVFYVGATLLVALLCCGPVVTAAGAPVLDPAPYRWLMALPGFTELRVVTRFWMLGVLTLSVSAGLVLAHVPATGSRRLTIAVVGATLLVAESMMPGLRMARPADLWPDVEPAGRAEALLELPLGPDWDWAATYRAAGHRRRVVNGVSGYDPPHYIALRTALEQRDPRALTALASFGPIDVVVSRAADPDDAIARFVAAVPGMVTAIDSGPRRLFRLRAGEGEPDPGRSIPIAAVRAYRHGELLESNDKRAPEVLDADLGTSWSDLPQTSGQWLDVDLGLERVVSGVSLSIGRYYLAFPDRLRIQASTDARNWTLAWEGGGAAPAFLALVRAPLVGDLRFAWPPALARYLRIAQTGESPREWRVAEVAVHGPR